MLDCCLAATIERCGTCRGAKRNGDTAAVKSSPAYRSLAFPRPRESVAQMSEEQESLSSDEELAEGTVKREMFISNGSNSPRKLKLLQTGVYCVSYIALGICIGEFCQTSNMLEFTVFMIHCNTFF